MKKILYITTVSRTINAFLVPHIHALLDKGIQVDCACCIDKEIDSTLINRGVKVYNIPFSRNPLGMNNYHAFKKLKSIQKENKYDFVHIHTPIAGLYGRLLKLKFPKLKTIYTAHGFHFHKSGSKLGWIIYYPIERIMSSFTDVLITINEEDYERAKTFHANNVYKINGVGIDFNEYNSDHYQAIQLREKYNLNEDDFVIAMIAEINANKNHRQMIDAIKELHQRNIPVKVLCAGEGVLFKEIKEELKNNHLDTSIQLLGFCQNVKELIAISNMGLLLSYREGLPRRIMELMCFKKPVIGTNIRGSRDLILHEKSGYLVSVGDSKQTAVYIEQLYNNPQLVHQMGEVALETMKTFSIETVLKQLEEILSEGGLYES